MLEVTFNTLTTKRIFRVGQNDRADDLMTGNLRSQKYFPVRKLKVGEFYELTAWTHMFPFILHLFDLVLVSYALVSRRKPRSEAGIRIGGSHSIPFSLCPTRQLEQRFSYGAVGLVRLMFLHALDYERLTLLSGRRMAGDRR